MTADRTATAGQSLAFRPAGMPASPEFDREIRSRMLEQLAICLDVDIHDLCTDQFAYIRDELEAAGLGREIDPEDFRQWEYASLNPLWLRTRCLCIVLRVMVVQSMHIINVPREVECCRRRLRYAALWLYWLGRDHSLPIRDAAAARATGADLLAAMMNGDDRAISETAERLSNAVTGPFWLSKMDLWG